MLVQQCWDCILQLFKMSPTPSVHWMVHDALQICITVCGEGRRHKCSGLSLVLLSLCCLLTHVQYIYFSHMSWSLTALSTLLDIFINGCHFYLSAANNKTLHNLLPIYWANVRYGTPLQMIKNRCKNTVWLHMVNKTRLCSIS